MYIPEARNLGGYRQLRILLATRGAWCFMVQTVLMYGLWPDMTMECCCFPLNPAQTQSVPCLKLILYEMCMFNWRTPGVLMVPGKLLDVRGYFSLSQREGADSIRQKSGKGHEGQISTEENPDSQLTCEKTHISVNEESTQQNNVELHSHPSEWQNT